METNEVTKEDIIEFIDNTKSIIENMSHRLDDDLSLNRNNELSPEYKINAIRELSNAIYFIERLNEDL